MSGIAERQFVRQQGIRDAGAALCVISTYWSIGFIVLVQLTYALVPRIPSLSRLTA